MMKKLTVKEQEVARILRDGLEPMSESKKFVYQGNNWTFEEFVKTAQKMVKKGLIILDELED